jgi:hypothetical protein
LHDRFVSNNKEGDMWREQESIVDFFCKKGMEDVLYPSHDPEDVADALRIALGGDWDVSVDEDRKTWIWFHHHTLGVYGSTLWGLPDEVREFVEKLIAEMDVSGVPRKREQLEAWEERFDYYGYEDSLGCDPSGP